MLTKNQHSISEFLSYSSYVFSPTRSCYLKLWNNLWNSLNAIRVISYSPFHLLSLGDSNLISCFTGPTDPKNWNIEIKIKKIWGSSCFSFDVADSHCLVFFSNFQDLYALFFILPNDFYFLCLQFFFVGIFVISGKIYQILRLICKLSLSKSNFYFYFFVDRPSHYFEKLGP